MSHGARPFALPADALRRVVVTSSRFKPEAHPLANELVASLRARGAHVDVDLEGSLPLAEIAIDADLVFSVGGDGTLLGTARRLVGASTPVIGVNLGKLGFLAEFSAKEAKEYLAGGALSGWGISPRIMLQVQLNDDPERLYALNDVLVSQGVLTRLVRIDMAVDGAHAIQYRADGLIVSTPVGSTAYSLSLGGPILSQGLRAFVVTPMAPHSLTNRPIVLDGGANVTFEVRTQPQELALVVDGQERRDLRRFDRITVTAAPTDLMLVSSGKHGYFDLLRLKLGWGAPPQHLEP